MPRLDLKTCKGCGEKSEKVGVLSHTALCIACSERRLRENIEQMEARSGVNWTRWRVAMILAADPIGLDVLSVLRETHGQ